MATALIDLVDPDDVSPLLDLPGDALNLARIRLAHLVHFSAPLRQCFILAFIHGASRKVFLSPCTFKPDKAWMVSQAQAFVEHTRENAIPAEMVMRDRDGKYVRALDAALEDSGIEVQPLAIRSPNPNAFIERFVQSIQHECLDKFIVFGREHFDYVAGEYLKYYHDERPHQAKGNRTLTRRTDSGPPNDHGEVLCKPRLGGLLNLYYRKAA